jgi:hypothetical protein
MAFQKKLLGTSRMPVVPLLRQGITLKMHIPFMKILCAWTRQLHVQEAITPLLSAIQAAASVVHGQMEATTTK